MTGLTASTLFITEITFLPVKTLIGVISKGEGRDDQLTGHGAQLFAESFYILTDSLVSKQLCNTERYYLDKYHHDKNSKEEKLMSYEQNGSFTIPGALNICTRQISTGSP